MNCRGLKVTVRCGESLNVSEEERQMIKAGGFVVWFDFDFGDKVLLYIYSYIYIYIYIVEAVLELVK
jgi:hypothetical protein